MVEQTKKRVYLDYQSAKPLDPRVLEKMTPIFLEQYGNPSSLHGTGDVATNLLDTSKEGIAKFINAEDKDSIIFTSSATEANNLALLGFAQRNKRKGKHIIISEVEHISNHNLAKILEKDGFTVSKVPVDQFGRVKINKLKARIKDETILVSIQMANNEIGTIQPIQKITDFLKEKGGNIAFHTDAVAAEGLLPIDVQKLGIDLLTLSSNDIYGPKGVGALYIRKGIGIQPQIIGGGQERGLRSGSENLPSIVGFAEAAKITLNEMDEEVKKLKEYQVRLIKELDEIPDSFLNGHPIERVANNTHFRFDGIEGESILLLFKDRNIDISTGSACSSKTLEPSHTLISTGLLHEEAHGSLEITTGRYTKESDIDYILKETPLVVKRLRDLSPLYNK